MAKKLTKENYLHGFSVIFSYAKQFKPALIFIVVLSLLKSVGDAFIPYLTGKFLDSLVSPSTHSFLDFNIESFYVFLLILSTSQVVVQIIENHISFRTDSFGEKMYFSYMNKAASHLLNLPLSFHKRKKMSVITGTINNSGNEIESIFQRIVMSFSSDILIIITASFLAFRISPLLTGILIFGVTVYCIFLWRFLDANTGTLKKKRQASRNFWRVFYEGIDNINTVKAMVSDVFEKLKIKRASNKALSLQIGHFEFHKKARYLRISIVWVTRLMILILAIDLVVKKQMTIGEMVTFTSYVGMFFAPFINMGSYWQGIQSAFVSIEEAEKTLGVPEEKYLPDDFTKLDKIDGDIQFKNVYFGYTRNQKVLNNINIKINKGEVVALVGKSGEGKTTFIDLIYGHNFAQKGRVTVDGVDTKKLDLKFLRSNMAIVPQEVVLFNDTLETNIKYGSFKATKKQVEKVALQAHVLEFIEKMPKKWNQLVGDRGYKLSVGQKQRVAIARAMLRDPKILILDEPTSALDAESESIIQKSLEELMQGRTTFIIAHRLSTVRRADKILVFKGGEIVEVGKHSELIQKEGGVYRNLYELQVGLHD